MSRSYSGAVRAIITLSLMSLTRHRMANEHNVLVSETSMKRLYPTDQVDEQKNLSSAPIESCCISIELDESPSKRPKSIERVSQQSVDHNGIALIKEEYRILDTKSRHASCQNDSKINSYHLKEDRSNESKHRNRKKGRGKSQSQGLNKSREFGSSDDIIRLCSSCANSSEFSPKSCSFRENCRFSHDLRKYISEGRRGDLSTFGGKCPVFEVNGFCYSGWKCRFVSSHSKEIEGEGGRKELILIGKNISEGDEDCDNRVGVYNTVNSAKKLGLAKKNIPTEISDKYLEWLEKHEQKMEKFYHQKLKKTDAEKNEEDKEDLRAQYISPPFQHSEKRRIYFSAETPILAPLTTQGNLPFRRMCVDFGAQLTYSEMAMSIPLLQGQKSEWTLIKAHECEISPPRLTTLPTIQGYDNNKDLKFGAQISASKPWQAIKAAEHLSKLLSHLRLIDINCGCPIDLVYQSGAGSALLDSNSKLEKMIRGMNLVSGSIPITAKLRMGTKDDKPTAHKTIERLAFGGEALRETLGAPGCAAITLHGRSRQQRYTKLADWGYISECAALVQSYNKKKDELTDTIMESDDRTKANGGKLFFIGNGDCYSHTDYFHHLQNSDVDSVMIARGALIKPWIFEEIEKGQYLDKSGTQRLEYVEKFTKYGLETWGSDEVGIGRTRRFLLEWLNFAHRYIPLGILDHLPPKLNERPPAYRGRDDIETLLSSDNYLDWIKISEMFLGPAHKDFKFLPKHKSNSYEIEAEG